VRERELFITNLPYAGSRVGQSAGQEKGGTRGHTLVLQSKKSALKKPEAHSSSSLQGGREGGREGERETDRQTERETLLGSKLLQRRHLESRTEDGLVGNHAGGGAVLVPQTFKRRAANLRLAHPG